MLKHYAWLYALCLVIFVKPASSQSGQFAHAIGAGLFTGNNHFAGGIVYSPRFNFGIISDRSAFAIGTQLALGSSLHASYNRNAGGNSTSIFMADVPLLVTYNYGNFATRAAHTRLGVFTGAGYGFHNAGRAMEDMDDEEPDNDQVHVSGIVFTTGCRFMIGHTSLGIHFTYLFNNNHYNTDINGIGSAGLSYNIHPVRKNI
ncbi:hypothetical protein [Chitinophaga qingshengii]|uniref:Outer membrane protein beta-barrel domain-containing protein n=1 Tax=Chitinophaga qingshengii TaxID=1569794 RepID=A0ABR7TJK0_9BACT|nr:hypothetical protein [Chitinophaga qingshengii]MBC9930677.1 hypothetical protein [Chitinophaga qingshengii]